MKTADMRMIERGDGAGLAFESFSAARVCGEFLGQHLDRNDPIEAGISRLVYLAHAAGPDQPENFVRPEANAGHQRQADSLEVG